MQTKVRRYDLDWLRVLVFGLLIFYHVGMYFVPWGWHVKNNVIYDWMIWPMLFVNQWRLSILFVISGMGTCFALSHRNGGVFRWERIKRLGLPLIFGMLVVIPPQVYFERLASGAFVGNYYEYLSTVAFQGIYPSGNISWNHLWFLPYLLFYSLAMSPVFVYLRNNKESRVIRFFRKQIRKPLGIYLLCFPIFLTDALIEPFYNVTHAFIGDWFALTEFGILFFFGFILIALKEDFWNCIDQIKSKALLIGISTFTLLIILWHQEDGLFIHLSTSLVRAVNMWSWILVLFGYSAKYLNKKSRLLSYCNTAVYPFYILHQTITVALGFYMMKLNWSLGSKFLILSLATFLIAWILYELIIRRVPFLRPLFGLKKAADKQSVEIGNNERRD